MKTIHRAFIAATVAAGLAAAGYDLKQNYDEIDTRIQEDKTEEEELTKQRHADRRAAFLKGLPDGLLVTNMPDANNTAGETCLRIKDGLMNIKLEDVCVFSPNPSYRYTLEEKGNFFADMRNGLNTLSFSTKKYAISCDFVKLAYQKPEEYMSITPLGCEITSNENALPSPNEKKTPVLSMN